MSTPALKDAAHRFALALVPDVAIDAIRRTRLATTEEGFTRARRIEGQIPMRTMPPIPPEVIAPPDGADADDLADYLASLDLTYLPIADPVFTGGMTGADLTLSSTLTTVALEVTGNSNLGNSASDVILMEGHDRHKGNVPGIATGVALGTGGSVGVTIAGTDQVGVIALVSGTSSLTTGVMATITYAAARPNTNYSITVTPRGQSAGVNAVQFYIVRDSVNAWTIRCNVAPGSGVTLEYHYHVREYTNV